MFSCFLTGKFKGNKIVWPVSDPINKKCDATQKLMPWKWPYLILNWFSYHESICVDRPKLCLKLNGKMQMIWHQMKKLSWNIVILELIWRKLGFSKQAVDFLDIFSTSKYFPTEAKMFLKVLIVSLTKKDQIASGSWPLATLKKV